MAAALREGIASVLGGANAAIPPPLLGDTQFAKGLNVTSRGGLLRTRPRLVPIADLGVAGHFSGAQVYRLNGGDAIVMCCGSRVYHVPLDTVAPRDVGGYDGFAGQAHFVQADKYFIVQTGDVEHQHWPLILDGITPVDNLEVSVFDSGANATVKLSTLTHAEAKRVPIGKAMAYGHGRLFVATSRIWDNGALSGTAQWVSDLGYRFFVAGNVIQPENAAEILAFLETDYTSEGGAFSLASEMGFINAMHVFRNSATGSGLGALVVFAREGVSAFAVNAARKTWSSIDIGQVLFTGIGTESPFSVTSVNDDLVFRARDGLRTVRYTKSQIAGSSGSLSSNPMSREVDYLLALDDATARTRSSVAWAQNRVLMTVAGVDDGLGGYFRGLVSLDTDALGALSATANPAYDGAWTGLKFLQVLRARYDGEDQVLVLARNAEGRVTLWRFSDAEYVDGTGTAPLCRVQTRAFSWGDPEALKRVDGAELWFRDIRGDLEATLYWRPDGYPLWQAMNTTTVRAGTTGQAQHRYKIPFAVPPTDVACDPVTGALLDRGSSIQFCLEWRGTATLEKALFYAQSLREERTALQCTPEVQAVELVAGTAGQDLTEIGAYEV